MTNYTGPPEKERPSGYQAARPDQKSATTTDNTKATTHPRQCAADALRRRRRASYRLPVLLCSHADPWRPWRPEKLSPVQVEGAADAARHLLSLGLVPVFDTDTLRALYRRGGADRALAEQVHHLTGGAVA